MNTVGEPSKNLFDALLEQVRQVVREAVREELGMGANRSELHADDGLMDVKQAAEYLCVSPSWLYKRASSLPFCKKIFGLLRFDKKGMKNWLATRPR